MCYILINRDSMVLLHKHDDPNVLAELAWIECGDDVYHILPLKDSSTFKIYTNMELITLYRNITTEDEEIWMSRHRLKELIYALCLRLNHTFVDKLELSLQSNYVKSDSREYWKYVKGAKVPTQQPELFGPVSKKVKRCPDEEKLIKEGGRLEPLYTQTVGRAVGPKQAAQKDKDYSPVATQRPEKNNAPKKGTTKAIIWSVADELWEKEGKPSDKKLVLQIRKRIMDKLESDEGIKRTSASSELGNWQKARI